MNFIQQLSDDLKKDSPIVKKWVNLKYLEGLTSNKAHFIYELLQNAEDSKSKSVKFILNDENLIFINDGIEFTKSNFEALVKIGHSDKQNSIGKFGMGFKSIFSISKKPEVYSERYALRFEGPLNVEEIPNNENIKGAKFIIPFDEKLNPVEKTFSMLNDELSSLDPMVILFLEKINSVELIVNDEKKIIKKSIIANKPIGSDLVLKKIRLDIVSDVRDSEEFLLFQKGRLRDKDKIDYIQIAYKIDDNQSIISANRKICYCFFPTKVVTDLPFVIQAPFDINQGRELLNDHSDENLDLFNHLILLYKDSIRYFKKNKKLNLDLLKLLPMKDAWNKANYIEEFSDALAELLDEIPLIPYRDHYAFPCDIAIPGEIEIAELFNHDTMVELGMNPWMDKNICKYKFNDLRSFLKKCGVKEIPPEKIFNLLDEDFFSSRSKDWLIDFYEFISENEFLNKESHNSVLRGIPFVKTSKGKFIAPFDANDELQIYFEGNASVNYPIIAQDYIKSESIFNMFKNLGVKKASRIDEIKNEIISKYKVKSPNYKNNEYYNDMKNIVEFYLDDKTENDEKEIISNHINKAKILPIKVNKKIEFQKISHCYLYSDKLQKYFDNYDNAIIYKPLFKDKSFEAQFTEALESWGIMKMPTLTNFLRDPYNDFPIHSILDEYTQVEKIEDVTFEGLVECLASVDKKKSVIIWEMIIKYIINDGSIWWNSQLGKTEIHYYYRTSKMKRIDSDLVSDLRNTEWVFNNKGECSRPKDIYLKEIADEYFTDTELIADFAKLLEFKPAFLDSDMSENTEEKYNLTKDYTPQELKAILEKHKQDKAKAKEDRSDNEKNEFEIEHIEWLPTEIINNKSEKLDKGDSTSGTKDSTEGRRNKVRLNNKVARARGRLGEEKIFITLMDSHHKKDNFEVKSNYFTYKENGDSYKVIWVNKDTEKYNPYDILIEKNGHSYEYIEVKYRDSSNPTWIEISFNEWKKAEEMHNKGLGELYKIYIIYKIDDNKYNYSIIPDIIKEYSEGNIKRVSSSYRIYI